MSARVHYGTDSGPACGARFSHEGITRIGDAEPVTCRRCKRSPAFLAAAAPAPVRLSPRVQLAANEAEKYARWELGHSRAEVRGIIFRDRLPATAEALVLISVRRSHRRPFEFAMLLVEEGGRFNVTEDSLDAADFSRNGGVRS